MSRLPNTAFIGDRSAEVPDHPVRLLDWLRSELGHMAVREGCGVGHCGACTVLLENRPTLSCCLLAQSAVGAAVMSATEVAVTELGALLVRAFVATGAMQCGFCTPGMIVTAYALLLRTSGNVSRKEIQDAMVGNLCRCTGYEPIIEAIMSAACAWHNSVEDDPG
jgi:carbon-monoxide dehydrogenase small subunit